MDINFELMNKNDKKNYFKNLKHIGEVYAIKTNKGCALAQIAGVESSHGLQVCRIFSKLYADIPSNIEDVIMQKEDYVIVIQLSSMAHYKVNMAIKLGTYNIPSFFEIPKYTRWCSAFNTAGNAPFEYWIINEGYSCEIVDLKYFIEEVLKKSISDETWKDDFLKLNSSCIYNGLALIDMLENGFSLLNWKPSNIKQKTKKILNKLED